ncbi:MAG: FHA domain-containing protein [Anaerolineae bacterium]
MSENVSLEWTLLVLRLLAVAVLYAFLVTVVYMIWRDLRTVARQSEGAGMSDTATEPGSSGARLCVVSSGEGPLRPGDIFTLQKYATLGRAPDNHIVLLDTYVSSYHARLEQRDGEWWLTDLDSRNGTLLNNVPITRAVPLTHGDVIRVGQIELRLELED